MCLRSQADSIYDAAHCDRIKYGSGLLLLTVILGDIELDDALSLGRIQVVRNLSAADLGPLIDRRIEQSPRWSDKVGDMKVRLALRQGQAGDVRLVQLISSACKSYREP